MILKYFDSGRSEWVFVDKCTDVTCRVVDETEAVRRYDGLYPDPDGYDPANEGIVKDSGALIANKVFWMESHAEQGECVIESATMGQSTIKRIGYIRDGKGCAILSNMAVYLLSDDGKTIERLI